MEARRDKGDAIGDTSRLQAVELGPTAETPVESTGPEAGPEGSREP